MIGCVTAEGLAESNKAACMTGGAAPVHGVPSAAEGVARDAVEGSGAPGPLVPPAGPGVVQRTGIQPEEFRRPYLAEGHAAPSPANSASSTPGRRS